MLNQKETELDTLKAELIKKQSALDLAQRVRTRQADHIKYQRELIASLGETKPVLPLPELPIARPRSSHSSHTHKRRSQSRTSDRDPVSIVDGILYTRSATTLNTLRPPPSLSINPQRRSKSVTRRKSTALSV
jgi:hypothetical protein